MWLDYFYSLSQQCLPVAQTTQLLKQHRDRTRISFKKNRVTALNDVEGTERIFLIGS